MNKKYKTLLEQKSWKIFQIISEFIEGYQRLANIEPSISIFGSARLNQTHKYCILAQKLSKQLSNSGFSIVTGGGSGIMEAGNIGASKGKSLSVGLNIILPKKEITNNYQDISLKFNHFFSRKEMFIEHAKAFIVFPGGFGTLNELSEILVLMQTKVITKKPIILVYKNYWRGLIDWFKKSLLTEKMIEPRDLNLFKIADSAEQIIALLKSH